MLAGCHASRELPWVLLPCGSFPLNHYQHFPGFVYERARHCAASQTIEISAPAAPRIATVCSGCHRPAPGYDHLNQRSFEFVPLWGCMVVLLYCMRRVDCRTCGVRVEAVPWGSANIN